MLTAAVLFVGAGSAGAREAKDTRSPLFAFEQIDWGYPHTPRLVLSRLDPVSLERRGPTLDLGRRWSRSDTAWALSPDGRLLASDLADTSTRLKIVDTQTMEIVKELDGSAHLLAWPTPRRLIAFSRYTHEASIIDPATGSVVREVPLPYMSVGARIRNSLVLLTGGLGAPVRILRFGLQPQPVITLGRLWRGLETWPAGRRDRLPPKARAALENARRELAGREGALREPIVAVSVTPHVWSNSSLGCPKPGRFYAPAVSRGYRVILTADGRWFDYRVPFFSSWPLLCREGQGQPAISEANLLRVGPRVDQVAAADLAVDRRRSRAFVLGSGGVLAEVPLRSGRVRYRRVGASMVGERAQAQWLAGDTLVVTRRDSEFRPRGTAFLDTRTGRAKVVDAGACEFTVHRGLALVHGLGCTGFVAYGSDGRKRFELPFASEVWELATRDRYAYVRLFERRSEGRPYLVHVVDLETGRVVNQSLGRTRVLGETADGQ